MGLILTWTTPTPAGKWVSDRRLFLNAEGAVVEDGDAAARFLLVAKGGNIPIDDARRYGLINEEGPMPTTEDPIDAKNVTAPAETKHVRAPKETKHVTGPTEAKGSEQGKREDVFHPMGGA